MRVDQLSWTVQWWAARMHHLSRVFWTLVDHPHPPLQANGRQQSAEHAQAPANGEAPLVLVHKQMHHGILAFPAAANDTVHLLP